MLSTVLFLAVVGSSVLNVESLQAFKCDSAIIEKVEKYWNGGSNNDILEKLVSGSVNDKYYLLKSTPKYLKDEFKGCYATFTKEDGDVFTTETLYRIPTNGGDVTPLEVKVIEAGGAVKDRDDKLKRYSVYSDNGIVACYSCIDSDKAPTGPPAGFVIAKGSGGYTSDQLTDAVNKLNTAGINVVVDYTYECVA